jgi:hypothetical protein
MQLNFIYLMIQSWCCWKMNEQCPTDLTSSSTSSRNMFHCVFQLGSQIQRMELAPWQLRLVHRHICLCKPSSCCFWAYLIFIGTVTHMWFSHICHNKCHHGWISRSLLWSPILLESSLGGTLLLSVNSREHICKCRCRIWWHIPQHIQHPYSQLRLPNGVQKQGEYYVPLFLYNGVFR